MNPQIILEVVVPIDQSLPDTLQQAFLDWDIHRTALCAIYTIKRDYFDDRHFSLLDVAYKARQIGYWATSDGYSSLDFNV